MNNSPQLAAPGAVTQVFSYPFRIFFLSMAVWAVLVIPLWLLVVTGLWQAPLGLAPIPWHQHEMLFGILNAAIAGFLLTAVCVWTQTERLHGLPLVLLWGVWLLGRLLITLGEALPEWLVIGVNLAFLPLVWLDAARRVLGVRQARQYPILVILALLWGMQAALLINPTTRWVDGALIAAAALMLVIGGRITPGFSSGWLRQRDLDHTQVQVFPWLEKTLLVAMGTLFFAVLSGTAIPVMIAAALAGLISLVRILLWRGWLVRTEPLLWILHISLLWIPAGLLLLAGANAGFWAHNVWVHAIGLGAMGSLILGVITRVSLGHTGRPLTLPGGIVFAYLLLQAGALMRVLTALSILPWTGGLTATGVCWTLAFAIFLWRYTGILASPRADGRPG